MTCVKFIYFTANERQFTGRKGRRKQRKCIKKNHETHLVYFWENTPMTVHDKKNVDVIRMYPV